jgi:hypothetical protein
MSGFILQPRVYTTCQDNSLLNVLERIWIHEAKFGNGTFFVLSGFGNYNGGVRFYSTFKQHNDCGGQVVAFFGGSTAQNMTSKQLVERLLNCKCEVHIINRKKIFHSKCYGSSAASGEKVVVTSGNFTGPGISHNVETCLYLNEQFSEKINFRWLDLQKAILSQQWEIYSPSLENLKDPAWSLLYDEHEKRGVLIDESQNISMVLTLGHSDTARINATPGSEEGKGSQYFWLSKDCFDFFPPLTILNERGYKTTNSCLINLYYSDLGIFEETRVTFEAGNNVDFRLGTPRYRYTNICKPGDIAVISRISEINYQIMIVKKGTQAFRILEPYAITFIGHKDKRYGYISNKKLEESLGIGLVSNKEFPNK